MGVFGGQISFLVAIGIRILCTKSKYIDLTKIKDAYKISVSYPLGKWVK